MIDLLNFASIHGLIPEEYNRIKTILGRQPTPDEIGVFAAMWSEHCSYKSSKKWLRTLPTEGPQVIQGPGENAGVVSIGDNLACVFKIESHNHPSFIEPYQGAATGVGGIIRDVFTMGARPIAILNALRFGDPEHSKTRHLVSGVVSGIAGYGNCIGVPTVGGECDFDSSYNGNILVNAMTVGIAPADRIFYSAAAGIDNPVVYVGAKTGRDGINGAVMASAVFDDHTQIPTTQVGDPFTGKLLLEACLELMAKDAIIAIQDMGAAGLTSSAVEMASRGKVGITIDLDLVPIREIGMSATEILLSESQERMLMVLKPDQEMMARAIFDKWGLDFAVIGRITEDKHFTVRIKNSTVVDIPVSLLVDEVPEYDRPFQVISSLLTVDPITCIPPNGVEQALITLLGTPDQASKRWIWEQYDHIIMGQNRLRPGGNAAVINIPDNSRSLAITIDCTPRYCQNDPITGGRQVVAEAWRNLTAVGAVPIALTNNLNFGDPTRPEIMGQLVGCITGITEACQALDFPVVSGNVSLYNETNGQAILPTPAIGGVGLIEDNALIVNQGTVAPDHDLILIGHTSGHLGSSIYLRDLFGLCKEMPPPIDLAAERRNGDLVRYLITSGWVLSCHDLSDGGLALSLAEMALSGRAGIVLDSPPKDLLLHAWLFGEDQSRYLIETEVTDLVLTASKDAEVPATVIGKTVAEPLLTLRTGHPILLTHMREIYEGWFSNWIAKL